MILVWNDGNDATVALAFCPATTLIPVSCVKNATAPLANPCSPTVYVPGLSPSIVTVCPGANFTVLLNDPLLTITRPESRAAGLAEIVSDSPPIDGAPAGSRHASTVTKPIATAVVSERIGPPHGFGNVTVMPPTVEGLLPRPAGDKHRRTAALASAYCRRSP